VYVRGRRPKVKGRRGRRRSKSLSDGVFTKSIVVYHYNTQQYKCFIPHSGYTGAFRTLGVIACVAMGLCDRVAVRVWSTLDIRTYLGFV
jgi:hypothetical protein